MYVEITCPACHQGMISIEPRQLAAGSSFSCSKCAALIKISPNSIGTLTEGLDKFDQMKEKLRKLNPEAD